MSLAILLIYPFSNKFCFSNVFPSDVAIRPVLHMVTICAQYLQIIFRIVFSVFIYMMNNKACFVIYSALFALCLPVFSYGFRESYYGIFNFCIHRCVCYCRAASRAKSSFFALICFSSRYYFSAHLARLSLMTRKGTIKPIFVSRSNTADFKYFPASQTIALYNSPNISAFFRAINLSHAFSGVMSYKKCLTNRARIHDEGHYAFT